MREVIAREVIACEMSVSFFPRAPHCKPRGLGLLCLFALGSAPVGAQVPAGRFVVPRAARVDIGHTGIHTHANSIVFDTGERDLTAMQADPVHFPHLTFRAHSRLPTDHAALPPDMAMPGDPPLPNPYGPIDGGAKGPGWSILPLHQVGHGGAITNVVKVVVPTRFANWVALQSAVRRKVYFDPKRYWLEGRWGRGSGYKTRIIHL